MAKLLNQQGLLDNKWTIADNDTAATDIQGYSIVSLNFWQDNQTQLEELAQSGKLALHLNSDETADLIAESAQQFALICIDFPKFSDGRGYSTARLLREKYGYKGELRAVGDVLIDQLFYMQRCGFGSFDLRDDQIISDAIAAFSTFSVCYQNDVHDPRPLYRRR